MQAELQLWGYLNTRRDRGRGSRRRVRRVVVEIAVLDGHDVLGVELILVVFAIVETDDAAFQTDLFENLLRFQDLVGFCLTFDDG